MDHRPLSFVTGSHKANCKFMRSTTDKDNFASLDVGDISKQYKTFISPEVSIIGQDIQQVLGNASDIKTVCGVTSLNAKPVSPDFKYTPFIKPLRTTNFENATADIPRDWGYMYGGVDNNRMIIIGDNAISA